MTPEYLDFRCCMCPNVNDKSAICPGIEGTPHPEPSVCRFVKSYIDDRGWVYFVRAGIGGNTFKTFFKKPGKNEHGYKGLPWRDSFDEAQSDLNKMAKTKGWMEGLRVGTYRV